MNENENVNVNENNSNTNLMLVKHPKKRGVKRKPDVCRICGVPIKRPLDKYRDRLCPACSTIAVMKSKWSKRSIEDIEKHIEVMQRTIRLLQDVLTEKERKRRMDVKIKKIELIGSYDEYGYDIEDSHTGNVLYHAGNNPNESSSSVLSSEGLPIEVIKEYCNNTGEEMAMELHGIWLGCFNRKES